MSEIAVHVVVACTDSKKADVPSDLRLRHYRGDDIELRVARWVEALQVSGAPCIQAAALYKGDHWQVARAIALDPPAGIRPTVWVCSAGYGLVAFDESIRPYSATFAPKHADSVAIGETGQRGAARAAAAQWWRALSAAWQQSPRREGVFTLAELAATTPETPILVAGSPHYLHALSGDISDALGRLRSPDLLSLFSAGLDRLGVLTPHLIPIHGGFQMPLSERGVPTLSGAYPSLNVRAARLALEVGADSDLRSTTLSERFQQFAQAAPPASRPERRRVNLSEAEAFLRDRLAAEPGAGHSRLLREFRASGRAFEYKRFRTLVDCVRADVAAAPDRATADSLVAPFAGVAQQEIR